MKFAVLPLMIGASLAGATPPPRIVAASGRWAALREAGQCDAASLALLPASKTRFQGRASLSFDRGTRHGQFTAALSKPVMPGASVIHTIDDQPYLLLGHGASASSLGPAQEAAIIAALRVAARMKIEARSQRGVRFIDRYDLAGAPTAIDAAAACATAP